MNRVTLDAVLGIEDDSDMDNLRFLPIDEMATTWQDRYLGTLKSLSSMCWSEAEHGQS